MASRSRGPGDKGIREPRLGCRESCVGHQDPESVADRGIGEVADHGSRNEEVVGVAVGVALGFAVFAAVGVAGVVEDTEIAADAEAADEQTVHKSATERGKVFKVRGSSTKRQIRRKATGKYQHGFAHSEELMCFISIMLHHCPVDSSQRKGLTPRIAGSLGI